MRKGAFDKTFIKGKEFKNRFIRSAIWEGKCETDGTITPNLIKFYDELARGGVGTIITGYANVIPYDRPADRMIGVYDDKFIVGLRKLTDTVHQSDCNIFLQIAVGGSQGRPNLSERFVGPTAHTHPITKNKTSELTVSEILELEDAFASAAIRAKKANFDGVEIHGAHGYLLSQFMNPTFNQREDMYGCDIKGRSRFLIETYEKVREAVGEDYIVAVKINSQDFMENGATEEDMIWVCEELSRRGIDLIEVSGGTVLSRNNKGVIRTRIKDYSDEGYFENFAKYLAEKINTPISLVGGIRSWEKVCEILDTTKIEYISLARPLLYEPNLINIWKEENYKKSSCISCNGCLSPNGATCVVADRLKSLNKK